MNSYRFKQQILPLQPAMQRMAQALLHDEDLAEDAVQDAVMDLWKQRDHLDKVFHLEAYAITLVKRRCVDQLRRLHPTHLIDEETLLHSQPPPDNTDDLYLFALQLINRLPNPQREALLLKYEHDKTNQQIAQQLHTTPNNIGVILHRALQSLRKQFKESNNL